MELECPPTPHMTAVSLYAKASGSASEALEEQCSSSGRPVGTWLAGSARAGTHHHHK